MNLKRNSEHRQVSKCDFFLAGRKKDGGGGGGGKGKGGKCKMMMMGMLMMLKMKLLGNIARIPDSYILESR